MDMIIPARGEIELVETFSDPNSSGCGFRRRFGSSADVPAVMRFVVLSPPNLDLAKVCGDGWTRGRGFRVWVLVGKVVSDLGLNRMAYEIERFGNGGDRSPTGLRVWVWGWKRWDLKRRRWPERDPETMENAEQLGFGVGFRAGSGEVEDDGRWKWWRTLV